MQLLESVGVLLIPALAGIGVLVGVFAACRELLCWYFKINERLGIEKRRNEQLDDIAHSLKVLIQAEVVKKKERDEVKNFSFEEGSASGEKS
ncbi:hypothetical protein [Solidesulfovibrio sp.]|uniref:hypothetical protein n=1 Tax=Solidesulfovibrio sp. TaxID=2910990 RepID=UPI002B21D550|nr:hypothetical protein [Solidesulfovibrio sp.]MEA5087289.1 hypothetical protein [Solidesulfovibrio sp.]